MKLGYLLILLLVATPASGADISTLGVTYGSSISGASLSTILNGHNTVEVTGAVNSTGDVTISNSALVLTGTGSINPTGNLYIDAISSMSGLTITSQSYWRGITGATITSNTFTHMVRANIGDNSSVTYNSFTAQAGEATAFKIGGSPLEWNGTAQTSVWKSTSNATIQHNIMTGGTEETTGWDVMDGGATSCRGTITAIAGNIITVSVIESLDSSGLVVPGLNPLGGNSAVGTHVLLMSGTGKGQYYAITAHSGNNLTLDTSKYSLSGVASGDHVTISAAFTDSDISYNTITMNVPNTASTITSLSMFGASYGNTVHNNTIHNIGSLGGIGLGSMAYALYSDTASDATYYDWKLNAHNSYSNNTVTGFKYSMIDVTYGTYTDAGAYWDIRASANPFRTVSDSWQNNTFDGLADTLNIKNSIWVNNVVTPNVNQYGNPWSTGSGASDTTWAQYSLGPLSTSIRASRTGIPSSRTGIRMVR
jgi:hypothetical protein